MATDKLNSAYSIGGPGLLVRILKSEVFPGIKINHVIDVNFGGFAIPSTRSAASTPTSTTATTTTRRRPDYSSIDIQPGYQKLCGTDALEFVRFRHTDTDIVRNARQQDFLRWAKSQFSRTRSSTAASAVQDFGQHVQSDA